MALTPVTPQTPGFTAAVSAAFGAFFGLFIGTAQGSGLLGVLIGAGVLAALAFAFKTVLKQEKPARLATVLGFGAVGYALGGVPALVIGALLGWFFGWLIFFVGESRYRRTLAPYLTPGQVLWHYTFRIICGAIFVFLITPILVVLPLSFNAENFFTFTPEMLRFDPEGYSLRHYKDFFSSSDWQNSLKNSVMIAPMATILSVGFGTLAAIGLSSEHVPFRRAIMAILISPMIVPLIISAAGMYFFYSRIGLQGTYLGVVLAHAALGIPFVIITVTATLVGFDRS